MESAEGLSREETARFAAILAERKQRLLDEIRNVLARSGNDERYDQVAGAVGDAGDESVAILMRDLANAEVARDVREVRDIVAAEERIAAGQYGYCIECGAFIGVPRLEAYPSAKRCFRCQQLREKTRTSTPHPTL
jgi:RNA polymerase-binding transcription factor DksA